jgi:hypothetical protein
LVEKVNVLRSLVDYYSLMYPQIQEIDFRRDATASRCTRRPWRSSGASKIMTQTVLPDIYPGR